MKLFFPFHYIPLALFLFLLLSGSGCVKAPSTPTSTPPTSPSTEAPKEIEHSWTSPTKGLRLLTVPARTTHPLSGLTLVEVDPTYVRATLVHDETAPRTVEGWLETEDTALLAINGSYFHEDLFPSGYLVAGGERIGDRAFDWSRSGTWILDTQTILFEEPEIPADIFGKQAVLQSYPILIKQGVPAIQEDSGKIAARSFVGLDASGHVLVGCLPRTQVSLFTLANELTKLPVTWEAALNLDGGPSSGCAFRFDEAPTTYDSLTTVPNAILLLPK